MRRSSHPLKEGQALPLPIVRRTPFSELKRAHLSLRQLFQTSLLELTDTVKHTLSRLGKALSAILEEERTPISSGELQTITDLITAAVGLLEADISREKQEGLFAQL